MSAIGQRVWVIPGGWIPASGTGREPDFTSRDELWLLNTSEMEAEIELTMYWQDHAPVGPYPLRVGAERVRCVRINDLIDPEALRLEEPYALVVRSSVPIVVQIARYDTRKPEQTMSWSLAFPVDTRE
jgi:hypothetical protein